MEKSDKILLGIIIVFYSLAIVIAFTNRIIDWSVR